VNNQQWEDLHESDKVVFIDKRQVWEAYKRVKANRGGAGVDGQSIEEP